MAEPRTVRADANALNSEEIAALLPHRYPFAPCGPHFGLRAGPVGHRPQVREPQ